MALAAKAVAWRIAAACQVAGPTAMVLEGYVSPYDNERADDWTLAEIAARLRDVRA